jgi:hypothetical protein
MSQSTVVENREKAGSLRTEGAELQWLGDPKNKPLLNAENLTVTGDGRLFVTGSERVCEITADGTGGYVWTDIPLPDGLSKPMFRNGIASDDRYLYLACAEIDQNAQPFLTGWLPQLTKRPQDALGFTLLLLAETLCPVQSYVLRADLSVKPLRFGNHIEFAGKCFANGLAVDKNGNVYVASGSGIHRVPAEAWTAPSKDPIKLWHRTDPPVPNGIKATDKKLFFTRLGQPPLLSSMVTAMALDTEPKVLNERLCWQNSVLYDDFDVEDDGGFVVAAVSDFTNMLGAFAGALVFFDASGARRGEFRDSRIKHPSAVVVLRRDTPFGAKGDLLLTEKESHTVWRLRLDRRG